MARLSNTTEFDETDRDDGRTEMGPADEAKLAANIELPASPAEELDISNIIGEGEREKLQEQEADPVSGDDGKSPKTIWNTIKAAPAKTKAYIISVDFIASALIVRFWYQLILPAWLFLVMGLVFLLLPAESVEELVDPGRSRGDWLQG